MGYRIHYGETVKKEYLSESKRNTKSTTKLIVILIICCVVSFVLSKNMDALANYLLPGNKETTRSAISAFAEDLRDGESVRDAVAAFCREIIENANIQD